MEAENYMREIKQIRRTIRLLKERVERDYILAAGVSAIRYDKDVVQTSPVGDRMIEIVARITETTEDLKKEIIKLQEKEAEATRLLVLLDEKHERVLTYHYLDGMDWKDVALAMNFNPTYIYDIKKDALQELDEVIKMNVTK